MLPEPLDGIDLRGVGRLKQRNDILRPVNLVSAMSTRLVHLNDDDLVRIARRKLVNELPQKVLAVEMVVLLKEVLSRQRFHQTIEPKGGAPPI